MQYARLKRNVFSPRRKADVDCYPRGICFTVCFFSVFLLVRSTISQQSAGRFTPKFACGRTLVPDVSSPLLGVSGRRGAEKGQIKFSLL